MQLADFLKWIMAAGSGIIAYWMMENIGVLKALAPEWKRYAALAIAGALAVLGFLASVGIGYDPVPDGWKAWIETVFAVIAVAIGLSQAIHGRLRLSKR